MTNAMKTSVPKSAGLEKEIFLRPAKEEDAGFIFSTWVSGYHFGNGGADSELESKAEMTRHRRMIEYVARCPVVKITVAVLREDPDVIIAYSVYEPKPSGKFKLHWLYVKPQWRNVGLGKSLVPEGTNEVTHLTAVGKSIVPKEWAYAPLM